MGEGEDRKEDGLDAELQCTTAATSMLPTTHQLTFIQFISPGA
jgi:hypothetical protein